MSDLIERKAAIETIRKLPNAGIHWFVSAEAVFDALLKLPSVQPKQKWIPVTERLPEKPKNYPRCEIRRTYFLVSFQSGCVKTLGYEFDRDEWQITGSPVVAWMPLPEPYREDDAK